MEDWEEAAMAIWGIVDPSALISGLERYPSTVNPHPAPTHDLILAAIAIAVWAIAIAWVAAWLRARETAKAREHIRSIRFARLDGDGHPHPNPLPGPGEGTEGAKRGHQADRPHISWTKSRART